MRWTIPALNRHELVVLLSGMKADPPPNRYAEMVRLSRGLLGPERWPAVEAQLSA